MISKLKLIITVLAISFLFSSCGEESEYVPQYPISIGINVDYLSQLGIGDIAYLSTNSDGYWVLTIPIPNAGNISYPLNDRLGVEYQNNGLIIYKSSYYTYIVMDRTCTNLPETNYCQISEDSEWNNLFNCPCCGSRFIVSGNGGLVFDGPAYRDLMIYNSQLVNNMLIISNY